MTKYKLSNFDNQVIIEIDKSNNNLDFYVKEWVEFWAGWQTRLQGYGGDYLTMFLHELSQHLLWLQKTTEYNTHWTLVEFAEREAGFNLLGKHGIRVIDIEYYSEDYDLELKIIDETKKEKM